MLSETARQAAFVWPACVASVGFGWLVGFLSTWGLSSIADAGNSSLADLLAWVSLAVGLGLVVIGLLGLVRYAIRR